MTFTVWIWEIQTLELRVVINHQSVVKSFDWSKLSPNLAIITGKNKIGSWTVEGTMVCDLPFGNFSFLIRK